ncbi:PD-(D/E)XK nuclease family protein [Aquirufa nivalisilvae]|uniref:PD-(D/E)XK nuclease family protein n=1 Tax=Aquirufa nivalisilvae TaxID=2516557 RepID=UPI001032916C|nr:PD-(D/E)XK nuclease family protein [Aquirufa nivalisilvae]TBH73560.1 PD-(D/E)XK nuclease family protein [Aquirufa nivalisilvae]
MKSFLRQTAEHLITQHGFDELREVAIVMPSQRGALYLKTQLAQLGERPFLSPKIMTIEEFALQMTDSELMDPISLLMEAFACFKEVDQQVDFDRFVSWGQLMLKDFDVLDLYLVDPVQLFSFLSEAKSLERWGQEYGEDHPEKFITENTKAYFQLYDYLLEVYLRLKSRLESLGLVYRGMAYRRLVENLEKGIALTKKFKKIYFVGFNALSKAEEEIIRLLLKQGLAETLWDADEYYVKNKFHRAGNWLRNYAHPASQDYLARGPFLWMGKHLLEDPKKVQILGVANPSAQIYVAMEAIRQWAYTNGDQEQVALVLGDESLLDQVTQYIGEFKDRLNITMGFSIKKTQVFSLITLWWELTQRGLDGRYPMSHFMKLWNHPLVQVYVKYWSKQNPIVDSQLLQSKLGTDSLYVSFETIKAINIPLLHHVLVNVESDFSEILGHIKGFINQILRAYPANEWDEEAQAIQQAFDVCETLETSMQDRSPISFKSGKILLMQLLQQQKLTFEGPDHSSRTLHVMGLLETRTLDFDRVIILSLNEGSLPGTRKRESLIPTDIANMSYFLLPTFTQADAVTSYHFYRLLQRAQEVILCYVQPSEKSNIKEMSRFIKQIRFDWKKKNPNLILEEPILQLGQPKVQREEHVNRIEKTGDMRQKIKDGLQKRGLSASSVSMLMTCSMKYYFSQIVGLRDEKQSDDDMGADVFGTWIHKVLEIIDSEIIEKYQGNLDQVDWNDKINHLDDYLNQAIREIEKEKGVFELEKGFNYVLKEVAKTILENYLQASPQWESQAIELLVVEGSLETMVNISVDGETWPVKIKGRIDRMDRLGTNTIRIIDYKTGKVEQKDLKIGEDLMSELTSEDIKEKLFQLWLYKFLLGTELLKPSEERVDYLKQIQTENIQIQPGIISFRNLGPKVLTENIEFSENQPLVAFLKESEQLVSHWVQRLIDPLAPFEKTANLEDCQYCDFKGICHREV